MRQEVSFFRVLRKAGSITMLFVSATLCAQHRKAAATLHLRVVLVPTVFAASAAEPEKPKSEGSGVEYEFGRKDNPNALKSAKEFAVETHGGQRSRVAVLQTTTVVPD